MLGVFMSHFKTQQEIWKYVADGGAVVSTMGTIIKFVNGKLNLQSDFTIIEHWSPYTEPRTDCPDCKWLWRDCKCKSEPKPKTKVWRWERGFTTSDGHQFLDQTSEVCCEEYAAKHHKGFTKVPGSEREI